MTTSPPDGPSRDLRERCAHAHYRLRWARDDWRHMAPVHREAYYEVADAILAEIIAAGYVIVATDRLERLEAAAAAAKEFTDTLVLMADVSNERAATIARDLGVRIAEAVLRLQPGDLDPAGGGE